MIYVKFDHILENNLPLDWGSVKCRLRTDCELLFLGLENNGTCTIVVTFSFAWLYWPHCITIFFIRSQNAVSIQQRRNTRATNTPSHWSSMLSKREYQRVSLSRLSEEFNEVEKLFKKSIKRSVVIVGIERVQNPFMWEKYQRYYWTNALNVRY